MLRAINYDGMIPILLEALKTQQAQIENSKLFQNQPNPFSSETTIRFEIPNRVNNAQLYICNMNGTLLKTFDINQRGSGNVTMNGNELNAGMYMYTLVADSKEVDTKKMILTD